jgi:hypothetical protein
LNPFISGHFTAKYAAEWRTGVIDDLARLKPDWVSTIAMDNERLRQTKLADVAGQIRRDLDQNAAAPGDPLRASYITGAFSRDVAVAAWMAATVHVTTMFQTLLSSEGATLQVSEDPSGITALGFMIPNVSQLPWEAIAEFRDHPGSCEARVRLREIEAHVLSEDPADAAAFQKRVAAEITGLLFGAISELSGGIGLALAREAINNALFFIPYAGNIASLAETVGEAIHERRTWHAALIKLRSAATQPGVASDA